MTDILFCHGCKVDPSIVAHFDFIVPEVNGHESGKNSLFSAVIEMFVKPVPSPFDFFRIRPNVKVMTAQLDVYSVSHKLIGTTCWQKSVKSLEYFTVDIYVEICLPRILPFQTEMLSHSETDEINCNFIYYIKMILAHWI